MAKKYNIKGIPAGFDVSFGSDDDGGGEVYIKIEEGGSMYTFAPTPESARELADALYTQADGAEE